MYNARSTLSDEQDVGIVEMIHLLLWQQHCRIQWYRKLYMYDIDFEIKLNAQAASCGRCRFEQQGIVGTECLHCKFDDMLVAWELRLFDLQTHALDKTKDVTAEDALLQASCHQFWEILIDVEYQAERISKTPRKQLYSHSSFLAHVLQYSVVGLWAGLHWCQVFSNKISFTIKRL